MIETNEPKDGDFIAYIEHLQKQQAARLVADRHRADTGAPALAQVTKDGGLFERSEQREQRGKSTTAEPQRVARERFRQSAAPLAKLVGAVLPLLVGALVGLHWLIAGSGALPLVIAVVLLIYGARRVSRALQGFTAAEQAQASALIAQLVARAGKR
jgi:hypothetical protein